MDGPREGTWEYDLKWESDIWTTISNKASKATAFVVGWLDAHQDEILLNSVMFLSIFFTVVVVMLIYRELNSRVQWFRRAMWVPKRVLSWPFVQLRRRHKKWSEQGKARKMAKWKKGHIADVFYDAIHKEIDAGRLSKQEGRRALDEISKTFGIRDLMRIKTHPNAIKRRLEVNTVHEAGPKQEKPAWGDKPGVNHIPVVTDFLSRRKTRKTT